jgi:hypothetical protein
MRNPSPTWNRRRTAFLTIGGVAIASIIGSAAPADGAENSGPEPFACTLTPEPDAMPNMWTMSLGSVKATADGLAVLHRVDCDGRTVGWKWLTPQDILGP